MGFAKKLKRKKTEAVRKEQKKLTQEETKEQMVVYHNDKLIERVSKKRNRYSVRMADRNFRRLSDYVYAYYFPQFIRVLRKEFGYGFTRLKKFDEDVCYYMELYGDKRGRFITKEDIYSDFKDMNFTFTERRLADIVEGKTTGEYVVTHCQNLAKTILNHLEMIWYAALIYRSNFGRSRLEKAYNAFRKAEKRHIGRRTLFDAMKKMEKECFIIRNGVKDCLDFSEERKMLDELTNKSSDLGFVVKSL